MILLVVFEMKWVVLQIIEQLYIASLWYYSLKIDDITVLSINV